MIAWRLEGKIIRTVLCGVVYNSCPQLYVHTCEQFLNVHVGLDLDLASVYLFRLSILYVFCVSLDNFIPLLLAFGVSV